MLLAKLLCTMFEICSLKKVNISVKDDLALNVLDKLCANNYYTNFKIRLIESTCLK